MACQVVSRSTIVSFSAGSSWASVAWARKRYSNAISCKVLQESESCGVMMLLLHVRYFEVGRPEKLRVRVSFCQDSMPFFAGGRSEEHTSELHSRETRV